MHSPNMHSRRKKFGTNANRTPLPLAPSSMGSMSKSKRPGSRSKHQTLQYILIFFVGCIIIAYFFAIKYITDGGSVAEPPKSPGGGAVDKTTLSAGFRGGKLAGGGVKKFSAADFGPVTDWRINSGPGMTPDGQQKLRDEQEHKSKDLSELLPKLKYMKENYPVAEKGKRTKSNIFKPYDKKNRVQLDKKFDKKGKLVYEPITKVKKEDLLDMGYDLKKIDSLGNITHDEAIKGRERLVDILHEAGIVEIDPEAVAVLPKWSSVVELYGDKPVILGLERCEEFRSQTDPIDASVGTSGMFNTGTNPMAMYVSNNCKMPNNKKDKAGGTRWQVPWGKHRLASEKLTNTPRHEKKTNKTNVMPIVLVRDPYTWMQSMCRHKYEARWVHDNGINCPNLAEKELQADGTPKKIPMMLKYNPPIYFDSLADYWGRWYKEYLEADYPRLIVRFEDIHFHARELIETIAQCVGAVPREEDGLFRYIVDSAKWGKAHSSKSNMISAMVKYGTEKNRFNGMKEVDWMVAKDIFAPEIMDLFGYKIPDKLREENQ